MIFNVWIKNVKLEGGGLERCAGDVGLECLHKTSDKNFMFMVPCIIICSMK